MVTGCASGIGAQVARQVAELGGRVTGLDLRAPDDRSALDRFVEIDLSRESLDRRGGRGDPGPGGCAVQRRRVSSGIGDPMLVVRINFLGTRRFTEALEDRMPAGSSITSVSSLAAASYRENARTTAGLLDTATMADGLAWCEAHPDAIADGGYRLSRRRSSLYGMRRVSELGARGIGSTARDRVSPRRPFSTSCGPRTGSRIWIRSPLRWGGSPAPTSRRRSWSIWAARAPVTLPVR